MSLIFWIILIVIGVFDAREYRIPNYLIIFLFSISAVFTLFNSWPTDNLNATGGHILGFFLTFFVGIAFYTLKVVAAGDVKLIAIIGLLVGYSGLYTFTMYLVFCCCFIGGMYWLLNRLMLSSFCPQKTTARSFKPTYSLDDYPSEFKSDFNTKTDIAYMPFAPIIIVALAMYQYFQY